LEQSPDHRCHFDDFRPRANDARAPDKLLIVHVQLRNDFVRRSSLPRAHTIDSLITFYSSTSADTSGRAFHVAIAVSLAAFSVFACDVQRHDKHTPNFNADGRYRKI
jgi:hypothetical protein